MGVHWKIRFLGGGHKKPIYKGELPEKGAWQFADLRGAWWKREGGVFEGGW